MKDLHCAVHTTILRLAIAFLDKEGNPLVGHEYQKTYDRWVRRIRSCSCIGDDHEVTEYEQSRNLGI